MKTRPKVSFKEVHDKYELPKSVIDQIDTLIALVNSNIDWVRDPRDFVLRRVNEALLNKVPPFGFDAKDTYRRRIGVKRVLTTEEGKLCDLVQALVDQCKNIDEVNKVRATIFERFMYIIKQKEFGRAYLNVNVLVNGVEVENDGYKTADIAVDLLDIKDYLELSECCLTIGALENKMHRQFGFYTKCFKEIRSVVTKATKLKFLLLVAHSGGRRNWNNVIFDISSLRQNSVGLRGCNLLDNTEEDLI